MLFWIWDKVSHLLYFSNWDTFEETEWWEEEES